MRSTPHFGLNRKNDFYDKNGQLKDGYSYKSGNGMVARGTGDVSVRYGAGKDGTSYKIEQRTVYGKEAKPAPAPVIKQAAAPRPAPKPAAKPKPVQLSKEVATAIGRSEAYQDTLMERHGDYVIAGDEEGITDFNEQTEQNIKEALKPYYQRDVDPTYAQSYADWQKLQLGDDFILKKLV